MCNLDYVIEKLMMEAVRQNGNLLEYASYALKNGKELVSEPI